MKPTRDQSNGVAMIRQLAFAAGLGAGLTGPAFAQWQSEIRPTSQGTRNTGFMGGLRGEFWIPKDSTGRDAVAALVEAGVGIRGSWQGVAALDLPGQWPGWKLSARLSGQRDALFEYFGLGNETGSDRNAVAGAGRDYFRVGRRRYAGRLTVARRVIGPLAVAGWVGGVHTEFQAPDSGSRFEGDQGRFSRSTEVQGGIALVVDSRDRPADPRRGLFIESGISGGTAANGYRRLFAVGRAYLPLTPGTVVAVRVGGAGRVSGVLPLDARFVLPLLDGDVGVLGGRDSFRGLQYQRLAGDGVLWGNLDLRQHLARIRGREIRILGFVDAGRVFENEPVRLGLSGVRVGWGAGLAFPTTRSVGILQASRGPDGVLISGSMRWQF